MFDKLSLVKIYACYVTQSSIIIFHVFFAHFFIATKMSTQFFSNLSRNYIGILEDDENYDITIEVGEDANVKIFHAHTIILCHRSPYLRRVLANKKKNNNDNVLTHIKLPNILPEIFQIILK
jgi:hypothetical protein